MKRHTCFRYLRAEVAGFESGRAVRAGLGCQFIVFNLKYSVLRKTTFNWLQHLSAKRRMMVDQSAVHRDMALTFRRFVPEHLPPAQPRPAVTESYDTPA